MSLNQLGPKIPGQVMDSKTLVENAPSKIVEGLERGKAIEIAEKLKATGATVRIINDATIDTPRVSI